MDIMEDSESSGLNEGEDHVDKLRGRAVPPVVGLQRPQHLTGDLCPDELFGVVETGLDQVGQIVVLGGADEAGNGETGERAAAGVEVVQQHLERLVVELNDMELRLQQLVPVHLLGVGADTQLGQREVGAVGGVETFDRPQPVVLADVLLARPLLLVLHGESLQRLGFGGGAPGPSAAHPAADVREDRSGHAGRVWHRFWPRGLYLRHLQEVAALLAVESHGGTVKCRDGSRQ